MNQSWKTILWQQFGAVIDMLENAIAACPDELWFDRAQQPEFWYVAYHTLFFLDLYLSETEEDFAPPGPFTLDELDPAGVLPEQPYTKAQLQSYLEHGRNKCRQVIDSVTDGHLSQPCGLGGIEVSAMEIHLYNMRHVQHHAVQLNLILRQTIDSAPLWVPKSNN